MAKDSSAVLQPNLGLFLGRAHLGLPTRAVADGNNFRVSHGKLNNINLGWARLGAFTLNGPVVLIDNFHLRDGTENVILATLKDLYLLDVSDNTVVFLSPRYETGTAAASGTAVTGTGTNWDPEAKAGDYIHFGTAGQTDPDATWYEIASRTNDTALVLTATAGTVVDGPYTIRKTFTGEADHVWSTDVFYNASPSNEDEWWATNGVDDVVRWNGTDDQVEVMSSLGFKAKVLGVYSNMMIFANLIQGGTQKPTDIINSNTGEPQNVSSGLSEQFKVHGNFGQIYKLNTLGDALAIYSRFTVTLAQFVGGDAVFAFRQVISNQGPIGWRAVADFGDYHQFVGTDGLYDFDGVTIRELGKHVFKEVLLNLKPANQALAYHAFNDVNAELIWSIPQTSDASDDAPSIAYTEHYLEDTGVQGHIPFARRDFPFTSIGSYTRQDTLTWDQLTATWASYNFHWNNQFFSVAFPLIITGDADGKVYTINGSQTQDGTDMESNVIFGRRPVFDGRTRGLITRVYPFATNETGEVDVTLHMSDAGEADESISDIQTFDAQETVPHFTTHYRRGRFYAVEFGSTGEPWEISGYDLDRRPGGKR